jgi:hypothetical protein
VARWFLVSAIVHAALWISFAALAKPRPEAAAPLLPIAMEIRVRPQEPERRPDPQSPRDPDRPRLPKRVASVPPSRGANTKPPEIDRPRGPEPKPSPQKWMGMRKTTVAVPDVRAGAGLPEGPPPPNALVFPDRTPLPVPGKGPSPLGSDAKPDGDGGYRFERTTFTAQVRRDGTVKIEDAPPVSGGFTGLGIGASFDLTDMIMRAIGNDPYAFEKLKILDATREARVGMARADRTDQIREALVRLPRDLARIWAYERWDVAERRRILFRLWDEVIEEGETELVRAGAQVRGIICSFIRQNLPADGPAGYTAEDLAQLNRARKSRTAFDPYSEP